MHATAPGRPPRHLIAVDATQPLPATPPPVEHLSATPPPVEYLPATSWRTVTWSHVAWVAVPAALGTLAVAEYLATDNALIRSGYLRVALAVSAVVCALLLAVSWLHARAERLHRDTRTVIEQWSRRVEAFDRDKTQMQAALRDLARTQQAVVNDVGLIGRSVVDLARMTPRMAENLGYTTATLDTITKQLLSIGGGQAIVHGQVEYIASHISQMRQVPAEASRPEIAPDIDPTQWQAYLRGWADRENT